MKKLVTSLFGTISASKDTGELTGKIRLGYLASDDYVTWDFQEKVREDGDNTLIIGYKLPDEDGEFIQVNLRKDEIILQSDYLGTRRLYYAEIGREFIFGTDISHLLKYCQDSLSIDPDELYQYLAFGFPVLSGNLLYSPIHYLESNSVLSIRTHGRNNLKISFRKLDRMLDYSAYANVAANEILQDGILKRIRDLALDKIVFLISAGIDSGILLEWFRELDIPVICGTLGLPDSDDVIIGRERARICDYEHYYSEDFFQLTKEELHDLLVEYSLCVGGIGPAIEAEFLYLLKNLSKYGKAIILGWGGELYRNRYPSEGYFSTHYLTSEDTMSKYSFGNYDKDKYLAMIYQKHGNEGTFEKFFIEERQPNNTRRNFMVRPYGVLISPLLNKYLYSYIFSKTDLRVRSSGEVMYWLRPEKTRFSLENKIHKPDLDINLFFSMTREIFEEYLRNGYDLTTIGINTAGILKNLKDSDCTERDKWFLSRILNLSIYLTHLHLS